jgi:hypothetical protein
VRGVRVHLRCAGKRQGEKSRGVHGSGDQFGFTGGDGGCVARHAA